MRSVLLRILKNGLLVAMILAGIGYIMAILAGVWLAEQPSFSRGTNPASEVQEITARLSRQLPLALAFWGFVVSVCLEAFLGLIPRGTTAKCAEKSAVSSSENHEAISAARPQSVSASEASQ